MKPREVITSSFPRVNHPMAVCTDTKGTAIKFLVIRQWITLLFFLNYYIFPKAKSPIDTPLESRGISEDYTCWSILTLALLRLMEKAVDESEVWVPGSWFESSLWPAKYWSWNSYLLHFFYLLKKSLINSTCIIMVSRCPSFLDNR